MLEILNLNVSVAPESNDDSSDSLQLLKNITLSIDPEKKYLLLGKNGAGKSTFIKALMGWPEYDVEGEIKYLGESIIKKEMSERANIGFFLAHQAPIEIPGLNYSDFMRAAYNRNKPEEEQLDPWEFLEVFESIAEALELPSDIGKRSLNAGFSGGERKKAEILQLLLVKPKVIFLDEVDSGLDLSALDLIFSTIEQYFIDYKPTILTISHNPKILEYYNPHKVLLFENGGIKDEGDIKLAEKVIEMGFNENE